MKIENDFKNLYEDFVQRLLSGDYNLNDSDKKYTEILVNSQKSFPELNNIPHYVFKINYLADIILNEFSKININITLNEIIESILREKVIVYHKKRLDPLVNQDVDYFFVLDSEIFLALGYKRLTEPLDKRSLKFKSEKAFIDARSIDVDETIERMLHLLGFNKTNQAKFIDKEILLSSFKEKNMDLTIYVNNDKPLSYRTETLEICIPIDNPHFIDIRINTKEKPLIDSPIDFTINDGKKDFYKIRGTISSQKTLKNGQLYRLDIEIEIKNFKILNNLRALLFFLQQN